MTFQVFHDLYKPCIQGIEKDWGQTFCSRSLTKNDAWLNESLTFFRPKNIFLGTVQPCIGIEQWTSILFACDYIEEHNLQNYTLNSFTIQSLHCARGLAVNLNNINQSTFSSFLSNCTIFTLDLTSEVEAADS